MNHMKLHSLIASTVLVAALLATAPASHGANPADFTLQSATSKATFIWKWPMFLQENITSKKPIAIRLIRSR